MDRITDGLQNFVTQIGSDVDPIAANNVTPICPPDMYTWFANGGIATKLTSFWALQMGSGIEIEVESTKQSGRTLARCEELENWLNAEFDRLDVDAVFIDAETQCHVDRAAPIAIALEQPAWVSTPIIPKTYDRVSSLIIQDPNYFYPIANQMGLRAIDHRFVPAYQSVMSGMSSLVHASRILPLQGRKLLKSEPYQNIYEMYWGRPICDPKLIESTIRYDAALAALGIVLQKKNFLAMAIEGLEDGFSGDSSSIERFSGQLLQRMKLLQKSSNLLNVAMHDTTGDIKAIERNLGGMADVLEKIKEEILVNCSIPQSYLFGMKAKSGGLSAAAEEEKEIDAHAEKLFEHRWKPLLRQLVDVMLGSRSCPVDAKGLDIRVKRVSGSAPDQLKEAEIRKMNLEADRLELDQQSGNTINGA